VRYKANLPWCSILNKDGKCYTFDNRGAGYGRGEGSATLVLKRLDDALAAGDSIRGVIRNTGINQDGKTNGMTLPNSEAQKDLARSIYLSAGLNPLDTGYVEAHGTGTEVGDRAEIESIGEVFCDNGNRDEHIFVGSVKSNIGHLEAASGLAGVIKTVMILEKGLIPANLNLDVVKKGLNMDDRKIKVAQKLVPWPNDALRRASVNSFGYGGTNAHAILEAAPGFYHQQHPTSDNIESKDHSASVNGFNHKGDLEQPNGHKDDAIDFPTDNPDPSSNGFSEGTNGISNSLSSVVMNGSSRSTNLDDAVPNKTNGTHLENRLASEYVHPQLFVVTAKSQKSLPAIITNIRQAVISHEGDISYLSNLAYTLSCRRSIMQWRTSFVAATHEQLVGALDPEKLQAVKAASDNRVALLFTGQGAQWHAMGRELVTQSPVFRNSLETSSKILKELGALWDLVEELLLDKETSRVHQSDISQPVTTAIQIALVDYLEALAIKPHSVLGHSSGEIGAAFAAGILSQKAALMVSYRRGFISALCKDLMRGEGAMLAVGIGEKEVSPYIDQLTAGIVCVACVNSPSSVTISGDVSAIDELKDLLDEGSVFNRKLKVDCAYHSHHMRKVSDQYLESIEGLVAEEPRPGIKFFSSLTGKQQTSGFDAQYWVDNLVSQVKFSQGLEELCQSELRTSQASTVHLFIEIGPHSALKGPIQQSIRSLDFKAFKYTYLSTLLRDKDAITTVLDVARKVFESGYPVDLEFIASHCDPNLQRTVITDLAPYSWDHSAKYWRESRFSKEHRLRPHPNHDLLGLRIVSSNILEPTWRHIISVDSLPWLRDHVVDKFVIFPGSGYLCMAIEAIRQITHDRGIPGNILNYVFKDISFSKALIVPESPGTAELLISLNPSTKGVADRNTATWENFRITSVAADGIWSEHCSGSIMVEIAPLNVDEVEGVREEQFSLLEQQEEFDSIKRACTRETDAKFMYKELAVNGNEYGPSFAAIKELSLGDCQAVGRVEIPDIAALMPAHFFQPHIIHPTTLDALMQLDVPLFHHHCGAGALMPVFLEELIISAKISNSPGSSLAIASRIFPAGSYSANVNFTVCQMEGDIQIPVVNLNGGELRRIGEVQSDALQLFNRKMSYNIQWSADINFLAPDTIQPPDLAVSELEISPKQKLETLDRAASLYIHECLMNAGLFESEISQNHHIQLLKWMKTYSISNECLNLIHGLSALDKESCITVMKKFGAVGEMLAQIGSNLESILSGKVEPLSLMLENDLLSRIYKEYQPIQQCHERMAEYIKLLSFKDSFLSILEIGAGTGSATLPILEALSHEQGLLLQNYDFTDISPAFFEKVKPKLESYGDCIKYKTLDIEIDPVKQGFEPGSYDLIVASNVLHATSRIDNTLSNVRKLLKPGGRLILVEITRLMAHTNVIFGVLPGWWAGVPDGREDSPLLRVDQWTTALLKNGFSGVDLAVDDYKGDAQSATFMVSRAMLHRHTMNQVVVEVICVSESESLHMLAEELVKRFDSKAFSASVRPWPTLISKAVVYIVVDSADKPILVNPSPARFHQVTALATTAESIIWITAQGTDSPTTNSPEKGMISGLARVARAENDGMKFLLIDIQQNSIESREGAVAAISNLLDASFGPISELEKSRETEFQYRDGQLHISRLIPDSKFDRWIDDGKPKKDIGLFHDARRSLKLDVETPGLLDSLIFVEDSLVNIPLAPDEVEIKTMAHGVNFKDVFVALGQMKATERMAGESSGIVTRIGSDFTSKFKVGDRVCAWASPVPFASHSRVSGHSAHILPDSMSFTTAASIPVVFLTAYHCLVKIANLRRGQTVLIHTASGGVGQAAVMIAQHIGAEIIATVGSDAKAQLLIDVFGLPTSHIFSSRLRNFKKGILRLTKGRGVDVVLNSLSGEALRDTWACIAPSGTFVEIGKTDIFRRNQLSMTPFDKMVTFASFDLLILRQYRSAETAEDLAQIMSMFKEGILKPVSPITELPISNIEEAFRLIASRKHVGKIVLSSQNEEMVKTISLRQPLRLYGGTYVVTGGLGDLGRRICHFLGKHGAKHIVTLSRRELDADVRSAFEADIRALGAELHIMSCDITDREMVEKVARICKETLPPVKGVIQAAMVLHVSWIQATI
jgi:acyl transferase domain-containing protein/NADPH:quinone reductase-like Zn-dependent oxidoreductase/SAM-dependent methyltransferase